MTVNVTPLVAVPPAVTTTFPVVAPEGTDVEIEVDVHVPTVAAVPLNVTVPGVEPKLIPLIVTPAPTAPEVGERPLIVGAVDCCTVNPTWLLVVPLIETRTFPDVAPAGTFVTIEVAAQLVIEACVPLNETVPGVEPKFVPVIVTAVPTMPVVGDKLLIFGPVGGVVVFELLDELTPAQPVNKSERETVRNNAKKERPEVACLIMGDLSCNTYSFSFRWYDDSVVGQDVLRQITNGRFGVAILDVELPAGHACYFCSSEAVEDTRGQKSHWIKSSSGRAFPINAVDHFSQPTRCFTLIAWERRTIL